MSYCFWLLVSYIKFNILFRQTSGDFYSIIGICVLWVIIINLFLTFKLRRISFLPLIYNQTIIMLLLSTKNISIEVKKFTNLLANLNLSLDFLTPDIINTNLGWMNDSTKMQNLHFYCNSIFLNYKFTIVFAVIGFFITWMLSLKLWRINQNQNLDQNQNSFIKCL